MDYEEQFQLLIEMNFFVINNLLTIVGMITDPDKYEKGKASIIIKDLGANVYREGQHYAVFPNYMLEKQR